jgi:hypothetical protein
MNLERHACNSIDSVWRDLGEAYAVKLITQTPRTANNITSAESKGAAYASCRKSTLKKVFSSHNVSENSMTPEQILRVKLRKIEALFAGAATPGEKAAAGAAAERIRERLGKTSGTEKSVELKFSIPDVWSRQLFIALCRRYGLRPFRHRRMHRQSILIKAPQSFMEQVLWPEFQELNAALIAYLSEITQKVIREEVHKETGEAEEIDEPSRIGR